MDIGREDLYLLVWAAPATRIGAHLGVSGNAVLKACRKRQIPVPGRGFWAKVAHGQPVSRTPLPHSDAAFAPITVPDEQAAAIAAILASADSAAAVHVTAEATIKAQAVAAGTEGGRCNSQERVPDTTRADRPEDYTPSPPDRDTLLALARRLDEWHMVKRLIDDLQPHRAQCGPAASALLTLWLSAAVSTLADMDPIADLISEYKATLRPTCRRWWEKGIAGTAQPVAQAHQQREPRAAPDLPSDY